jgi:hypothetical protein
MMMNRSVLAAGMVDGSYSLYLPFESGQLVKKVGRLVPSIFVFYGKNPVLGKVKYKTRRIVIPGRGE